MVFLTFGVFLLCLGHFVFAQNDEDSASTSLLAERYRARLLFTVKLQLDPTNIQIVEDPRFTTELIPDYEMVYMAHSPRSEIRRIPQFIRSFRYPQIWSQQTEVVADLTTIKYPNQMGLLPYGVVKAKSRYIWWVASGYVGARSAFPSNIGGIYLIDMAKDKWNPVAIVNTTGRGFTQVEWIDMDLDGLTDVLTIVGSNNMNELIWYRQPNDQGPWKMNRISQADVNVGGTEFKLMNLPRDGSESQAMVIVVAGRTSGRLTAYWVDDPLNDWTRVSKIRTEIIGTDGAYVNAHIVDLNLDGRKEVLTSISAVAGRKGKVIAYEHPKTGIGSGGKWRKHLLAEWETPTTNYQTLSPGPVTSFHINSRQRRNSKPHILVSGADDKQVYVLAPTDWSPYVWTYDKTAIFTSTSKIGDCSVQDIDGDGTMEIFIPTAMSINVMSYDRGTALTVHANLWLVIAVFVLGKFYTA